MSLTSEYQKQYAWRDWDKALSHCPIMPGQQVLDLGCGPGDLSAALSARGALVTGIDANTDLIAAAKMRCPQGVFEKQDLNTLVLAPGKYDGLWCSFTAAYFTDFEAIFSRWKTFLKEKAWVCIIEMDDLLGHEPVSAGTRENIHRFYTEFLLEKHYDFRMGGKVGSILEKNGFAVKTLMLEDRELSFKGVADPDVIGAWSDRFNRMGGLKSFLGNGFGAFREEFLRSISVPEHRSLCKVVCCIGTRG